MLGLGNMIVIVIIIIISVIFSCVYRMFRLPVSFRAIKIDNKCKYLSDFHAVTLRALCRPVFLHLDNSQSHLSVKVLDLVKEIFIVLLSFPPHTSHKLQPLDRSV
jgi:hypothetical protein